MKLFFLSALIFFACTANATNYYISAISGNDMNPGTSIGTPWKSLAKLSAMSGSFGSGDSILFRRGDTFYGSIVFKGRATPGLPITLGAYGVGAKPVITGFTTVAAWVKSGANTWESADAVSTLPAINMVVINGMNTPMGRYPNEGYLTYESFTHTSITSSSLNSTTTNWTGAIAVIRKNNWIADRDTITAQSGGVLTHTVHSIYDGINNYGFFIQDDSRTLDRQNEWYYNPATKKLLIYSVSRPSNVQVPTIDNLVSIRATDNITFTNLSFTGSNSAAFAINFSYHLQIFNCDIDFSGKNAITTRGGKCGNFKLVNSTINHTNNNAIDLGGASDNCLLSHDTIKNTGIFAGMGASSDKTYTAVQTNSDNGIVEDCFIDSTGYVGIDFYGNNTIVRNNFVSNFCMTKFDGAGIYTFIRIGGKPSTGEQLINNIVINGIGNVAGTIEKRPLVHGIYLDEGTANVEIAGNTVANNSYSGLYYHSSYSNNIHNNTFYNNGYAQILIANYNALNPDRNLKLKNNISVSKTPTQRTVSFKSRADDIVSFGKAADVDSNFYSRPMDDTKTIETGIKDGGPTQRTLAEWKTYSGFDAHSKESPKAIKNANDLRFEYNEKEINKTITLDATYVDITNKEYSGNVVLPPHSSIILIKKGT